MYARLVNGLPEGQDWLYEVKFDGLRGLSFIALDGVFWLAV
jgi:ATP-dependent DNA ligase